MGAPGPTHWLIIAVLVALFGVTRLPDAARSLADPPASRRPIPAVATPTAESTAESTALSLTGQAGRPYER